MLYKNTKQTHRTTFTLLTWGLLVLSMILALAVNISQNRDTHAAPVTGFQPGNIMSDAVFTNKNSMSASQIQSFLNARTPYCDTNGTKPSEYGGGTRKQYAAAHGVSTPFRCLKNYTQNGKTAARIIYDAAQEFNINPQVLIVLIQKEQGLITDEWPWPVQYRSATGYGCPDTAACDSQYYGLTNQVRWAARMFRAIMNDSPTWYTPYKLGNNRIYWHPDLSRCGSSTVNIQNRTTVALYSYTPYRPNQAALNAGFGTGNSCSSYGNRNFYQYFKNWFGNPRAGGSTATYTSLDTPRWMRLKSTVAKRNLPSGSVESQTLAAGTEIFFKTKTTVGGVTYLRTAHDTDRNTSKGIPLSAIEDFTLTYTPLDTPRAMRAKTSTHNKQPVTAQNIEALGQGTQRNFTTKAQVGGEWYLRSGADTNQGLHRGVPLIDLEDLPAGQIPPALTYEPLDTPRWMQVTSAVRKRDPRTNANIDENIPSGTHFYFDTKVTVGSTTYLRTRQDTAQNLDKGIRQQDVKNISLRYSMLDRPREMRLLASTRKQHPLTEKFVDSTLKKGRKIRFETKILIDGQWYLRSEYDTIRNRDKVIPLDLLK